MKNFKISISIISGLVVGCIGFLLFLINENTKMLEQKNLLNAKIQEARNAQREIDKVQAEVNRLDMETTEIEKMVPVHDEQPLSLIKQMTLLANQLQLKNAEFTYRGNFPDTVGAALENRGLEGEEGGLPVMAASAAQDGLAVQRLIVQMRFEGNFKQADDFFKKLFTLGRLVSVERIRMERDEKIMPRQKITLIIIAYSFLK
ncbi:MAG: hypothetical protein KKH34_08510 [Candidatus Omnitrophica bacterium]|nr:hypothetical protein [Candidatus Omnitrophota bacterium]